MSGLSCSEYGEVEQAAVNEAMWVILTGLKSISQHTCTDVAGTRRRQLLTNAVNIGLEVTVRDAAFNVSDKAEIAHSVQDDLAVSAASGDFSTLIADAAAALDSSSPLLTVIISETLAPTALPTPAPTSAPTTVWVALGGRHLALVLIGAALAVVMCGCAAAFVRSLVRHRRQAKEQNATARDVPAMSREMSALVLEEPGPPRAPEMSDVVDIGVLVADQESEGQVSQDDNNAAAPPLTAKPRFGCAASRVATTRPATEHLPSSSWCNSRESGST